MAETQGVARLNWGCGSQGEPGWFNSDIKDGPLIDFAGSIFDGLPLEDHSMDYVVSIHALPELTIQQQVPALEELRRVLKPGGALRLALPNLIKGVEAYQRGDADYFLVPDEDAKLLGTKLITQLLWYGYSKTLFVPEFVEEMCLRAGFSEVRHPAFKETTTDHDGITDLDNREAESLFVEAIK